MLNTDEILADGFAALRSAQPSQSTAHLVLVSQNRESRARVAKVLAGLSGCLVIGVAAAVALQPTSALADLKESARLTAAQPIVHLHLDRLGTAAHPTSPPWPAIPPLDIWKFPDHYVRKQGHMLATFYRDGRTFAYDDRFKTGFRSTYDATKDRFWTFDGTISEELTGAHRLEPVVQNVIAHGSRYLDYKWQDTDGMQNQMTAHVFVDPQSKLVRFSDSDVVTGSAERSHSSAMVDYPSADMAEKEVPHFPKGLKFQTREELQTQFDSTIARPTETKTLGGIRTTLYGVIVHPNVPDGLGVDVITRGGAGPDYGSGHQPEVIGAQLLPTKRSAWFPLFADPEHTRHGGTQAIGGLDYLINQSDDLLIRAPSKITIRVPVWRSSSSLVPRDGKMVHPHDFVGYVTFTTTKIFFNTGDESWSFFGTGHRLR